MENPIIEKIMKDGIESVNLSMLDDMSRKRILSDVGEKLYKQGKFQEAVNIMARAGEFDKLLALGDSLSAQGKTEAAAICYIPTKNKEKLNSVALKCIQSKNYKLAASAYEACDNVQMAQFIRGNF